MLDYIPTTFQFMVGLFFLLVFAFSQIRYGINLYLDPKNQQDGILKGALSYNARHNSHGEFMDQFEESILAEGYHYAGDIPNSCNALMAVYIQDLSITLDAVLLIEVEFFTLDMFLDHRHLFKEYLEQYSGLEAQNWDKYLHTVIYASEMSAPLQVLLSIHGIDYDQPQFGAYLGYEKPQFKGSYSSQVYAIVEKEEKVYAKTFKPDVITDTVIIPWVRKHILGVEDAIGDMVWQDLNWEDILYLDWQSEESHSAYRYESSYESNQKFTAIFTKKLSAEGYEYVGAIDNPYLAIMNVFYPPTSDGQDVILLIEVDEFSNSLLLEHRYMLEKFMKECGYEIKLQKGVKIITCVQKMTPALQILLCTYSAFPRKRLYYSIPNSAEVPQVFAMVEEEKKIYTMVYQPGNFQDQMMNWIKRYFLEQGTSEMEEVWKNVALGDIEGLPMEKDQMIERVR